MAELLNSFGGLVIGLMGAVITAAMCCVGSAKGSGIVGEGAAGLLSEDPGKLLKVLVLQLIPGTKALYGIFISVFGMSILNAADSAATAISVTDGLRFFISCMPMAFGGGFAAVYQGRIAAKCLNLLAKQPQDWAKGIVLCITVEAYGILSLIASSFMLGRISG